MFLLASAAETCSLLPGLESVKTLIQPLSHWASTIVTLVLSSFLKKVMDKLQHVQNTAACLVTETGKYEHDLSRLMHDNLH